MKFIQDIYAIQTSIVNLKLYYNNMLRLWLAICS